MDLRLADMFKIFHETSLVTIASVHGHTLAGGGGLAASCDIVLLDEQAKMGFPEVRRGLVAAEVMAILLRQICLRYVRELLLTGQLVDSYRAVEIGLANYIVTHEDLEKEALRIAEEVLKGGPEAIRESKYLLNKLSSGDFSINIDLALSVHDRVRHSQEAKDGIAAFLEKRKPVWD